MQSYCKPVASRPTESHFVRVSPNTDIIVHRELRRFSMIMSQPVRVFFFFFFLILSPLPASLGWYRDTRILSRGISPPRRQENCACTSAMELLWCGLVIGASCSSCSRRTACTPLIIRRQWVCVCVRAHIYMRAIWGVWLWWGMKMAQRVSLHVCAFHGVGGWDRSHQTHVSTWCFAGLTSPLCRRTHTLHGPIRAYVKSRWEAGSTTRSSKKNQH